MPLKLPLEPLGEAPRVWVGYSGGLDSSLLLALAVEAGLVRQGRLRALHVHHGLADEADTWLAHCRVCCRHWDVPLEVAHLRLQPGGNLEERARQARYEAFVRHLGAGDCLLLAHHADDQAETLLLRLLRGAGVRGLAAMPEQRALGAGRLWRPLLDQPRRTLRREACKRGLDWVEDASNASCAADRNYLRLRLMPLFKARWPATPALLGRAAAWQAEAAELLEELARLDARQVAGEHGLKTMALASLKAPRQRNLVRAWIAEAGLAVPSAAQLSAFLEAVSVAPRDRQPQLRLAGARLCRYAGELRLVAEKAFAAPPSTLEWSGFAPLELPWGRLRLQPAEGGLRLPAGAHLQVVWRHGGERIRPLGQGRSRSLKKLLQEAGLPPWQRQLVPLLLVDGELAAVADLWVCEGWQSAPEEPGWQLCWEARDTLEWRPFDCR